MIFIFDQRFSGLGISPWIQSWEIHDIETYDQYLRSLYFDTIIFDYDLNNSNYLIHFGLVETHMIKFSEDPIFTGKELINLFDMSMD